MIGILNMLVGLGSLVCFVMVLIKQFQTAGPLHGIIGLITCGLWTFIWGWMKASTLNLRNLMLIWTLLIVVAVVLGGVGGMAALSGLHG
jgi:hypothetical protein